MSLQPKKLLNEAYQNNWRSVKRVIVDILSGESIEKDDWQDIFMIIYDMCVAQPNAYHNELYADTRLLLDRHMLKLYKLMESMEMECMLITYVQSWKMFDKSIVSINHLYKYFNDVALKFFKKSDPQLGFEETTQDFMQIEQLGLNIWEKKMLPLFENNLIQLILQNLQRDRLEGDISDVDLIRSCIFSVVEMRRYSNNKYKLYEEMLEGLIVKETNEFYANKALQLLDILNKSTYVKQARELIKEENLRVKRFLPLCSHDKLLNVCRQQLVLTDTITLYLHQHAHNIINNLDTQDMSNLYLLCTPLTNDSHFLVCEMQEHIRQDLIQSIDNINHSDKMAESFVDMVIQLHAKYLAIVQIVFNNDSLFTIALDKAFNHAINHRFNSKSICQSPEYLAHYCDSLLRKGDADVEIHLNNAIIIFRYLDDKDVFNRFYSRMLAKRLIYCQSQSMEAEENMINKLKHVCGYEFTNKLHRMFLDFHLSSDLNTKFNQHLSELQPKQDLQLAFFILVLQAGAWPITSSGLPSFLLPQQFEKSVQMFELFYVKNYSGRKLNWIHSFCQCELKLNYLKKGYQIVVSTFVASILLHFNSADEHGLVTYQDLVQATNLPNQQLNSALQQLIYAKILIAEFPLTEDSKISLNFEYNNKRIKFKIIPTQKDTMQEVEQTRLSANEDRKIYLQATIVRIMKARRNIKHNQLIQEVLSQSRSQFSPSVSLIKRCIETLIDKQYIERVNNTNDQYAYIA